MIGSFLTRGLVMVLGYAYPAYECYKTVEQNKPEIEQLRFWCQYWILVALLTVSERIGDAFVSWVPMYSEAKLAFFIYLWYPKTRGTTYVYDSFFRPYVSKHETEIDRNLLELRTRAGDMAILYWQRAFSYGQTRIFDVLQYVAAQSTPAPRPAQPPNQGPRARQAPAAQNRRPAAAEPESEEPPSPTSSTSSSQHQKEVEAEVGLSQMPKATAAHKAAPKAAVPLNAKKTFAAQKATTTVPEATSQSAPTLAEAMQIEAVPSSSSPPGNESTDPPPPKETVMEETIRVTRGRLRKARSAPIR